MSEDDDDEQVPRQRSATYAATRIMDLLGTLRSAKHAGRIKALSNFKKYVSEYKPDFYDDDVELLLVTRGQGALKTTSKSVLQLVHWLVSQAPAQADGGNLFLDKFLELPVDDLQRMDLTSHIKSAAAGSNEPFELLTLLLTKYHGTDSHDEKETPMSLDTLLPDSEAQGKFTCWLQHSASEQQLMEKIEMQRHISHAADSQGRVTDMRASIQGRDGSDTLQTLDPLGITNISLSTISQTQPDLKIAVASKGLAAAKDRFGLLQKLQQQAISAGAQIDPTRKDKYTRDRTRALKANAAAASEKVASTGASIVPQDEAFDPYLFLTVVHAATTFSELCRGQAHLEKAMGSQAEQLQHLVQQHYDSFVHCADGIHWFKSMIAEEFTQLGGDSMTQQSFSTGEARNVTRILRLLKVATSTREGASALFAPLTTKMIKSTDLRSARLVLHRLAKVLDVPGRMARHEKAGHLEEVVREYETVRSLPTGSGLHLLTRVHKQAEAVAERLRGKLRSYVGSRAQSFEDLSEAADLLHRLGGIDEPLIFCFLKQAQLFHKTLDDIEQWYESTFQSAVQQPLPDVDGLSCSNREDHGSALAEETSGITESKRMRAGEFEDTGELESDGETEDSSEGSVAENEDSQPQLMSSTQTSNTAEQAMSLLRLNCVRRLVKETFNFFPTLLRLVLRIRDDLGDVLVAREPGERLYSIITSRRVTGAHHTTTSLSTGEVKASTASSDEVSILLRRATKACRRAMWGNIADRDSHSALRQMIRPLTGSYFQEALIIVAALYDQVFDTESSSDQVTVSPLKALIEEGQQCQAMAAFDRLSRDIQILVREERWLPLESSGRQKTLDAVCNISRRSTHPIGPFGRGTILPQEFCRMVNLTMLNLSSTLRRPAWCAPQVTAGVDMCFTQLLDGLRDLSHKMHIPQRPPQHRRLLILIANCGQLQAGIVYFLAQEAWRLFQAEVCTSTIEESILGLHESLVGAYVRCKSQVCHLLFERTLWTQIKGDALPSVLSGANRWIPSFHLAGLMFELRRVKAEVEELLANLPVLGAPIAEERQNEGYVVALMQALIQCMLEMFLQSISCLDKDALQTSLHNKNPQGLQRIAGELDFLMATEARYVCEKSRELHRVVVGRLQVLATARHWQPGETVSLCKGALRLYAKATCCK